MVEEVRCNSGYGIVLQAPAGESGHVPNPFWGTLVLGDAHTTYPIGGFFPGRFLQKGMGGIIYDVTFPVLVAARCCWPGVDTLRAARA